MKDDYDKDYFEDGIAVGKSCYKDYRWLPEKTLTFTHKIIEHLGLREGDSILDYGCAKGYLVKALRLWGIIACGCDISEYAINNADPNIKIHCKLLSDFQIPFEGKFNWIIAKDVLEHLEEEEIEKILKEFQKVSNNLFVIVPLGNGEKFHIPVNNFDTTHKLAKTRDWWENKFEEYGWKMEKFCYRISGMKDDWKAWPKGNGFFFLKSEEQLMNF